MPSIEDALAEKAGIKPPLIEPGKSAPSARKLTQRELERRAMVRRGILIAIWAAAALALIGHGLYLIYPPACPLGIGLLMWLFVISPMGQRTVAERDKGRKEKS